MLDKEKFHLERLEDWVESKCTDWRDHFEANYSQKFDEYYRLWRGQWSAEDKTRQSERSKIISPALTAGCGVFRSGTGGSYLRSR